MSIVLPSEAGRPAAFIANIKAVDNHTHVNSTAPNDADSDALPLDGLPSFPFPMRLRPENPEWLGAYKGLYGYPHNDLSEPHLAELRATMQRVAREQADRFPAWVLDKIGTEVMVANRIAMGPDYDVLYPLEEKLLQRYLADLKITKLPPTFDAYLSTVLRKLDFDEAEEAAAKSVYARYVSGGEPSHAECKALQDFLFRRIAHDAGRLGMAVHIHAFEGAGGFYKVAGSDPLLLEPAFNDQALRQTNFVIVDFSVMPLIYTPGKLAGILRDWLEQFPEKVLFGTDAFGTGPDAGWELAAWLSSTTARQALAIALTGMLRDKEMTRPRAEEIATMVLRTNVGSFIDWACAESSSST